MEELKIKINGKEYSPKPPKAGVWREVMEFEEQASDVALKDWLDSHADLIAKVFNQPEVTKEAILTELPFNGIVPLYNKCFEWLCAKVNGELDKIPNAGTAPVKSK